MFSHAQILFDVHSNPMRCRADDIFLFLLNNRETWGSERPAGSKSHVCLDESWDSSLCLQEKPKAALFSLTWRCLTGETSSKRRENTTERLKGKGLTRKAKTREYSTREVEVISERLKREIQHHDPGDWNEGGYLNRCTPPQPTGVRPLRAMPEYLHTGSPRTHLEVTVLPSTVDEGVDMQTPSTCWWCPLKKTMDSRQMLRTSFHFYP